MGRHNHDTEYNETHDPHEEALIRTLDAVGREDRGAPDEGFEARLLDHVAETIAPRARAIGRQRSWVFVLQGAAAAVLVLGAGALMLLSLSGGGAGTAGPGVTDVESRIASLEDDLDALDGLASISEALESNIAEVGMLTDIMDAELSMPSVYAELGGVDSGGEGSL